MSGVLASIFLLFLSALLALSLMREALLGAGRELFESPWDRRTRLGREIAERQLYLDGALLLLRGLAIVSGALLGLAMAPRNQALEAASVGFAVAAASGMLAERLARRAATDRPTVALRCAAPAYAVLTLMRPLMALVGRPWSRERIVVLQRDPNGDREGRAISNEESMAQRALGFASQRAHHIMVSRPRIVSLEAGTTVAQALRVVERSPHTFYPLVSRSLDEIVGCVDVRDLAVAMSRGEGERVIDDMAREACLIPESMTLSAILETSRREKSELMIVADEYGETVGLLTLTDLLQEIVGDALASEGPQELIRPLGRGRFLVSGETPLSLFCKRFSLTIASERYRTTAGYLFGLLGRRPSIGDRAYHDGVLFQVVGLDDRRISQVLVDVNGRRKRVETTSARRDPA